MIRLSAMGDVAMTAPVVGDVARSYPDVRIRVLTRPLFRAFYRDVPGVRFIDVDLKERHKGLFGLVRLFNDIRRREKIDAVADLHDVLRSQLLRMLFGLTGARVARIRKGRREKKRLTRTSGKILTPLKTTPHRYADVFSELGFPVSVPQRIVKLENTPLPSAILNAVGEKQGRWIGVAPFAQHAGKIYPVEKMEEVVRILASRENTRLFVFGGGPAEREVAERWEAACPSVFSVIGRLKLTEELDLMAHLDTLVSMDSASMHMASLVGTRVVSVWGATHPHAGFPGIGQSPADVVQLGLDCRPCSVYGNKPCARGDYACLNGIAPRTIVDRIENPITH
ncbi:MAG: glycosyltransferase family 9 protein [Rikenellaceae bacterium]|nr:glycosyltransferase family 9 protein [Rikenellaceae bacterium]